MRFSLRIVFVLTSLILGGCSTFTGWFTPQGQKLSQAQALADQGHPLGASALAVEALALDSGYQDAQRLLIRTFYPGQDEFRAGVVHWTTAAASDRWDHLFELYSWQNTLHTVIPTLPPVLDPQTKVPMDLSVAGVAEERKAAGRGAADFHWARARSLLEAVPGPRQARRALVEGEVAAHYDLQTPGLDEWLDSTREAATQKLLVIPFFHEGGERLGPVSGPLGSLVSQQLMEGARLPALTTVFPSDRLVTLPGGGPALLGLISQPDALKLAEAGGQNLVLMGQFTKVASLEPKKTLRIEPRERRALVVDPAHPQGVEKVSKAVVTFTTWTSAVVLGVSFSVVEVATGRDLITAAKDAKATDEMVRTTYTGDREALTEDDLRAVALDVSLEDSETLKDKALATLAASVADAVRLALK